MLNLIKDYQGAITVNGIPYANVTKAIEALANFSGLLTVELNGKEAPVVAEKVDKNLDTSIYQVKVRQYMTKPPSIDFDFHTKWNNGIPMPMRVMVGRKLQETQGLVKMELRADITSVITTHCMKCGKGLKNEVSRYFGVGPECGGHNYTHPFESKEELHKAVEAFRTQLREITWTGWIIKSAIEEETVVRND